MGRQMVFIAAVLGSALVTSGCATFKGWMSDDDKNEEVTQVAPASPGIDGHRAAPVKPPVDPDEVADLQLKLTRVLARVEELEEKFSRQQERLQIIERGLTLGIVPDELQPGKPGKSPVSVPAAKKTSRVEADDEHEDGPPAAKPAEGTASAPVKEKAGQVAKEPAGDPAKEEGIPVATREEFNKAFAAAHEDYRAGRYGKAIVGFSEIGKKFDPALTSGVHQFWIARSWAGLKELQTARQLFNEFITSFPTSPWAPRAKLELARVESALGLKETAIKRLRGVISEYPLEDVAEMAKAEVERMSRTL